ncbi:MAG TPA: hypothetical protein VKX16_03755 [Chloroflexota bacterium]|nr:hypothetical protein [Chloroflexota bacterium]
MADPNGTITETIRIRDAIRPGLDVYDREGKKAGAVWQIHRVPGYFTVQARPSPQRKDNPFVEKHLHVPFRLIISIDQRELFLSMTDDELRANFSNPPPRTTRVEDEYGAAIAVTTEPSGYDGTAVVVRRAPINDLKDAVTLGYRVFTSDPTELGTIKRYDPAEGVMWIARDVLLDEPVLKIPVAMVDAVNHESGEVYLVSAQADLERMEHLVPTIAVENNDKQRA